ncbi:MAG: hypothetical protein HY420_00680 [Candidatus Kerfeldbacteria bacterium]|nr:hypothetical protein [Candidatus Kerfeldbacteria bacterium]
MARRSAIRFPASVVAGLALISQWSLILPVLLLPSPAQALAQGDGKIVYGEGTVTTPRTRDWASGVFGSEGSTVAAGARHRLPSAMSALNSQLTARGKK